MRKTLLAISITGRRQEGPFVIGNGVLSLVLLKESLKTKRCVACGGGLACGPAEAGWVALACGRVRGRVPVLPKESGECNKRVACGGVLACGPEGAGVALAGGGVGSGPSLGTRRAKWPPRVRSGEERGAI